ncbi:MAG: glycine cleavage system protein R [Planctomycetota bacterium]
MPHDFVVSVMSVDRVGIIAGLSEAIFELDGNICALSQTVMRGYFTLIVMAHFDEDISREQITRAVETRGDDGELGVLVTERETSVSEVPVVPDADRFILTMEGPDQSGIVRSITSYLSSRNINIEDLYAAIQGESFLLIAQLELPQELEIERLQMDIEGLWSGPEIELSLQHEDIYLATNQIEFSHLDY